MGIINPRPAMRSRERRSIEDQLATHDKLMRAFIAEGFGRDEASRRAYVLVRAGSADAIARVLGTKKKGDEE